MAGGGVGEKILVGRLGRWKLLGVGKKDDIAGGGIGEKILVGRVGGWKLLWVGVGEKVAMAGKGYVRRF